MGDEGVKYNGSHVGTTSITCRVEFRVYTGFRVLGRFPGAPILSGGSRGSISWPEAIWHQPKLCSNIEACKGTDAGEHHCFGISMVLHLEVQGDYGPVMVLM